VKQKSSLAGARLQSKMQLLRARWVRLPVTE
jgi:hypothetical protein